MVDYIIDFEQQYSRMRTRWSIPMQCFQTAAYCMSGHERSTVSSNSMHRSDIYINEVSIKEDIWRKKSLHPAWESTKKLHVLRSRDDKGASQAHKRIMIKHHCLAQIHWTGMVEDLHELEPLEPYYWPVHTVILTTKKSSEIVKHFVHDWISVHGPPQKLFSDMKESLTMMTWDTWQKTLT